MKGPREVVDRLVGWVAELPDGTIEALEDLRRREQRTLGELERVKRDLTEIQRSIAMVEDALELRRWVEAKPAPSAQSPENGRRPARGRQAVMFLLNQHPPEREWTIAEVVRELAAQDLAEPDDAHAVSVSLSRLFRAGKVQRPRKGVYTLMESWNDLAASQAKAAEATTRNRLFTGTAGGEAEGEGA